MKTSVARRKEKNFSHKNAQRNGRIKKRIFSQRSLSAQRRERKEKRFSHIRLRNAYGATRRHREHRAA